VITNNARGVLAIVFKHKDTVGIIACSSSGIITYRTGKKEWWIPSDQCKEISNDENIMELSR
jgi:hypothetical protein